MLNQIWQSNSSAILVTALLSMVPMFEGRYAVATCISLGVPPVFAYFLALICSSIPIPIILLLLRPVLDWFYTLPIGFVRKFAAWLERYGERKRQKMLANKNADSFIRRHFSAQTAELIALYIFVAVPLPGTGVWSGSAIATLFKMPRLKSGIAIFLGNVTACLLMTLGTTGALSFFG